jgi:flagellum-specific ATP synthase
MTPQLLDPGLRVRALAAARPDSHGRLTELRGLHLIARGVEAGVGELVEVHPPAGSGHGAGGGDRHEPVLAEVVAATGAGLVCVPLGSTHGLRAGAAVRATGSALTVPVGRELTGRVLDGLGRPLDDGGSLAHLPRVPVENDTPHALRRGRVDLQLGLGVRALDALVTCGRGQRIGIMAGSGVGKSTLLSMVARGTEAAVSVIALVGERGREVREFLENDLGPEGLARSVVVVATSDAPAVERLRAAFVATRIAEWFRDEGEDVVLMMDSLTRVAMAQREIGLSAGEPPATRGYPPSVFGLLPRLLERAGPGHVGSITGLYTVLVEGDDLQDPVGDTARSILDGHVVLSRRLATGGHFPSIDVLESVSRVVGAVTTPDQRADAVGLRRLLAAHREVRELVEIGAYVPGGSPEADRALALLPLIDDFLRQEIGETTSAAATWQRLHDLMRTA